MARITVEDCLEKIDNQYDLVLLAKERTAQLNAGDVSLVPEANDKNTVISLREIGEGKISIKTLEDSAINKLRNKQEDPSSLEDQEEASEDSFDKIYKGEVSKSGTAILPSKRIKRIPEKVNVVNKKLNYDNNDQNKEVKKKEEHESISSENKSE